MYTHGYVCVHIHACKCEERCPHSAEESIGSPEAGVKVYFEPLDVGAGN